MIFFLLGSMKTVVKPYFRHKKYLGFWITFTGIGYLCALYTEVLLQLAILSRKI